MQSVERKATAGGFPRAFTIAALLASLAGCSDPGAESQAAKETGSTAPKAAEPARETRPISTADLEDKIRGGWAGQMIGVSYGAPTEFRYLQRIIPLEEMPEWTDESVRNAINQDDLYVDMTFFSVLDNKGWDATVHDYGEAFRDSTYSLWHANYAARRALRRGVPANLSGTPEVNPHVNDIDFQIEADFIGLLTPGMPQTAVALASEVGQVMNGGDGILGGVFVAGLYSAAFFENDPRAVVESSLDLLPDSTYRRIIADTLTWSAEHPDDWQATWQLLEDKYATGDVCPQGAGVPFNIDAHLNGAYIALGLLYGGGDFEKTMEISTRAGQDSDCNPASAAGVLGVMLGYRGIPDKFRAGIPAIAETKFAYTDYSYEDIVARNVAKVLEAIQRNGGRVDGGQAHVPTQAPTVARVRLFDDYGHLKERIGADDARIVYTGDWDVRTNTFGNRFSWTAAQSDSDGAEAELAFTGTGVIVTAMHQHAGGLVEVWLDGVRQGIYDTFSEEPADRRWGNKMDEAVWHRFGLPDTEHTVRIRVLGKPYVRDGVASGGAQFAMQSIVVFQ